MSSSNGLLPATGKASKFFIDHLKIVKYLQGRISVVENFRKKLYYIGFKNIKFAELPQSKAF